MNNEITDISGHLLLQIKKQEDHQGLLDQLQNWPFDELLTQLKSDTEKKTFWINIYNSYYQILALSQKEELGNIYKRKEIYIAGYTFSLDEIEHGILRKYRWKLSKGYLPNIFYSSLIKKLAVQKIDYRIHFALNCGAVSCPPIAFYNSKNLHNQLDMATRSFLESETSINDPLKQIQTSSLLNWFSGDFGGKKGSLKIIGTVFQKDLSSYSISYKPYNWEKQLANFA